jgi:hypothetical protein
MKQFMNLLNILYSLLGAQSTLLTLIHKDLIESKKIDFLLQFQTKFSIYEYGHT